MYSCPVAIVKSNTGVCLMRKEAVAGIILIVLGVGLFAYYNSRIKPEDEGAKLLNEGIGIFERDTKEAVNEAINIFNKVIANYPGTKAANDAAVYVAQGYEKTGLNRLAYIKYAYILKSSNADEATKIDIRHRLGKLNVMKQLTDEGVHQMMMALNETNDPELRSRIYTELGHVYLKQGNASKALQMFDIAVGQYGNNEEAILGKARAYKRLGQDEKAYDLYDYFLKYYGDFSLFANDIKTGYIDQLYDSGYNSYKKKSYWKALEYFQRFLKLFPENKKSENAMYWTGECYFALKRYDTAISWFNKVLANGFTQKDEDATIKLGYCYFLNKRFDTASEKFRAYINAYPSGRHVETARKWQELSNKELSYKIMERMEPEESETEEADTADMKKPMADGVNEVINPNSGSHIKLENVAEI